MRRVKTALLSVSDKTDIVVLAKALSEYGIHIVSTGNTAKALRAAGIRAQEVSDYTGSVEMLEGRVKTLHPRIHAGILARRDKPAHVAQLKKQGIGMIDMVVVNLYPFEKVARMKKPFAEIIENIDIGGPTLLRAAAKNSEAVAVVSDPCQYGSVIEELRRNHGAIGPSFLERLRREAFEKTAAYDAAIAGFLNVRSARDKYFPARLAFSLGKKALLRYGENPHQAACFYEIQGDARRGIAGFVRLRGKELSFNNILDLDITRQILKNFSLPSCAVIKHTNPCGVACAKTLREAFTRAFASDPLSAFGGIVGLRGRVNGALARTIMKKGFLECIMATGFDREALALFSKKKNLILVVTDFSLSRNYFPYDLKKVEGGMLLQEKDTRSITRRELTVVTKKKPTPRECESLLFAWKVAKFVKSNAIVVAKGTATVGIGMGQSSRVDSAFMAIKKAGARARSSCMASDGFFPKPDSVRLAWRAGIRALIQPGGSIGDSAVIKEADKHGMAMVFTRVRHFRH